MMFSLWQTRAAVEHQCFQQKSGESPSRRYRFPRPLHNLKVANRREIQSLAVARYTKHPRGYLRIAYRPRFLLQTHRSQIVQARFEAVKRIALTRVLLDDIPFNPSLLAGLYNRFPL